jgi:hypothetical protein
MEKKFTLIALSMVLAAGMILPLSAYGVEPRPQGIEYWAYKGEDDPLLPPIPPPPEGMPSQEEIMLKHREMENWHREHMNILQGFPPCDFNEIEPNDIPPPTQAVTYGDTVCAYLYPDDTEWDFYLFTGTAGDYITVDVEAMTHGGDVDPQVYITDEFLSTLAFN